MPFALDDVLLPLCRRYGANLVTGAGELSITAAPDFANRPARIFYIADFDPAGHGMPVSVARKIKFFLADQNLDLDIRLQPIVLTLPQVKAYRLPQDVAPGQPGHKTSAIPDCRSFGLVRQRGQSLQRTVPTQDG